MLVASRFAQGIGDAIAVPAAFGLVALLFTDPKERATAIGITGGVAGLGGTLGPVISGLLISVADWRWIFYVNVPVAVMALVAVSRLVAESRATTRLGFRPNGRVGRTDRGHPWRRIGNGRPGGDGVRVHRSRRPPLGVAHRCGRPSRPGRSPG